MLKWPSCDPDKTFCYFLELGKKHFQLPVHVLCVVFSMGVPGMSMPPGHLPGANTTSANDSTTTSTNTTTTTTSAGSDATTTTNTNSSGDTAQPQPNMDYFSSFMSQMVNQMSQGNIVSVNSYLNFF